MIICETKTKVRIESGWLLHGLVLKMTVAYCGYWESTHTHTHIHHPPTPAFVGMVLFYWRAFHGPRSMGQNLYLSYPFSLCFPCLFFPTQDTLVCSVLHATLYLPHASIITHLIENSFRHTFICPLHGELLEGRAHVIGGTSGKWLCKTIWP